ncbi:MAG TPA: glucanase, partial [Ignavibacteria bacterium]|nr:glucanase [Ignavibacteria bacterium]
MNNIVTTLKEILAIDSPTGYTIEVTNHLEKLFSGMDVISTKTNKGSLLVSFVKDPELIVTGHIDTLGAMVKEIKDDGTLEITRIGGLELNSFEGEYVTIRNFKGELFRGTFLLNNPASHVNKKLGETKR